MSNLIVPIYSMRSYETNKYSILKDGNFKLHINRMDRDNDFLVVPTNCSDLEEFLELGLVPIWRILRLKYGTNAYESRRIFWHLNKPYFDSSLPFDNIVTDFTGYEGQLPLINNFNITKDPNNPKFYIDDFIDIDIISIKKSIKTYVLNQCQKDYLVSLEPSIEDKIIVSQKVVSDAYFNHMPHVECDFPDFDIFFPFRISDKAYQFEMVVGENPDKLILITDPNDSYKGNYKNVVKKKFTKLEYYSILRDYRATIHYHENPQKIFHPGLADFLYFNNEIISEYQMPTREEVLINDQTNFY